MPLDFKFMKTAMEKLSPQNMQMSWENNFQ